jgi:type III secretion protein V
MPAWPFCLMAGLLISLAFRAWKTERSAPPKAPASTDAVTRGAARAAASVAPLMLELDCPRRAQAEKLAAQELERVRAAIASELGVQLPPFHVRVHERPESVTASGYLLLVDDVPAARGELELDSSYARARPEELTFLPVAAAAVQSPWDKSVLSRIAPEDARLVARAGIHVQTGAELLSEHLTQVLRGRASQLLGVQEVQALLDELEPRSPSLVREASAKIPLPLMTDVLRRLVEEEVSVKNLRVIHEALVSPSTEGDAAALAERCRQFLHRYLTYKYAPSGSLFVHLLDPEIEELLRAGKADEASVDPTKVAGVLEGVRRISERGRAVVLTAPDVRRVFRKLCEGSFPELAVLTYGELDTDLQVRPLGRLAIAG